MENRIVVTESLFTEICKKGYLSTRDQLGNIDVHFTKNDIKELCAGKTVEKEQFEPKAFFTLVKLGEEMMNILKRSPVYYDLYEELNTPS
jgi:hypothetical protein